jgi:hypothetical protein
VQNNRLDRLLSPARDLLSDSTKHPPTEEERRQMFVGLLATRGGEVFEPGDPRADRAYLATRTLGELHVIYREWLERDIAAWKATNPPELEAFRQLDIAAKVEVLCGRRRLNVGVNHESQRQSR